MYNHREVLSWSQTLSLVFMASVVLAMGPGPLWLPLDS